MGDPRRKNDDGFEQEAMSVLQGGNDTGFDDEAASVLAPKTAPATAQPQSMFTEPDPNLKAPDARGVLEQLVDPSGRYGQAVADAGGDPIQGMVDANGGPNAMLEHLLSIVSPGGAEAGATEKLADGILPFIKKIGGGAATGAIGGGAIRAGDAYRAGDDDQQVLEQFISGLTPGAITGGSVALAGSLGAKTGLGIEKAAAANADWTLLRSTGMTAQEVQALGAEERGALAEKIRDSGMTKGFAPSMRTINDRAKTFKQGGLDRMSTNEDAINELDQPPNVPVADLINQQRAEAAREGALAPAGTNAASAYRSSTADRLEADTIQPGRGPVATMEPAGWNGHQYMQPGGQIDIPSGDLSWKRALEQRRAFDDQTNFAATNQTESNQNAINKQFGGGLRDRIDEALNVPSVPPEMAAGWRGGRDAFSLGSDVYDTSLRGMPSNNAGYIPTNAAQAAQQAAGFFARNGGMSAISSVSDATAGLGDFGARMGMSMANEAGRVGQGAASATEQLQQVQSQSRGQMQPQIVESLLDSNPQALGPYAQPLAQARKDGTLNQKLTQLRNTDDVWQRQFLPQLQQMSAQAP